MTERRRLRLFVVGAAGLGVLLVLGVIGLPDFGGDAGPYGRIINAAVASERHVPEAVGAIVFDYRGIDSLGEETIFFAAVAAVALVLREQHDELEQDAEARRTSDAPSDRDLSSDAIRVVATSALPFVVLLGLYLVGHGHLSPGGGFQGGVVVAAGLVLLYLVGRQRALRRGVPSAVMEPIESTGLFAYAAVGVAGAVAGAAVLQNVFPLGQLGRLASGGTIPWLSLAVGTEVTAGLVLVVSEFVEQLVLRHEQRPSS